MSVQISAYVADETKENMEQYSAMHGIKKGFLIENALDHYLQALQEIPTEFIVPNKLILSDASFQEFSTMLESTEEPTEALKELMRGE